MGCLTVWWGLLCRAPLEHSVSGSVRSRVSGMDRPSGTERYHDNEGTGSVWRLTHGLLNGEKETIILVCFLGTQDFGRRKGPPVCDQTVEAMAHVAGLTHSRSWDGGAEKAEVGARRPSRAGGEVGCAAGSQGRN